VEFELNQALFGYDGGHQLLAASLSLPTEARHFLAVATDLSGSAPARGFDHSYTGVPLPGTSFYALFCTWLAPEMSRPGCVWSHALLIDLADIAEFRNFGTLRAVFQRPLPKPMLEEFSHPLRVSDALKAPLGLSASRETIAGHLLATLYGEPERSVVMPATDASAHEELIFALWSQQWPRLRRNFRFSTGSFSDRGREGPAFDIQITPEGNLSSWHPNRALVLNSREMESSAPIRRNDALWFRLALNDLLRPDSLEFRKFVRIYGADVTSLRAAFVPLARIHARFATASAESWTLTLRAIATDFPAPSEAGTLKLASLSKPPSISAEARLDHLVDSIGFLCHEDTTGAFGQVNFDFKTALAELWPARREALGATLARPPVTEARWHALEKALADRIGAEEIPWLWETHPGLLVPFIRLNPDLAAAPEVWRLPDRTQWAVIEGLEAAAVSQPLWREITRAMLTAGTTVAAREVTQRAGPIALDGALDWLIKDSSANLPPPLWRKVLRPLAEERLTGGMLTAPELAFCAVLVRPSIAAGLSPTRADLRALNSESLETLPAPLRLPTAFLLVTLGIQASSEIGAPLLACGFFPVYEALEGATEPPEAWRLLQPHLPMLWFWEEWDRCLRLRRALENWVQSHPGTLGTILAAARKPSHRKWLESLGRPSAPG